MGILRRLPKKFEYDHIDRYGRITTQYWRTNRVIELLAREYGLAPVKDTQEWFHAFCFACFKSAHASSRYDDEFVRAAVTRYIAALETGEAYVHYDIGTEITHSLKRWVAMPGPGLLCRERPSMIKSWIDTCISCARCVMRMMRLKTAATSTSTIVEANASS